MANTFCNSPKKVSIEAMNYSSLIPRSIFNLIKQVYFKRKHFSALSSPSSFSLPREIKNDRPAVVLIGHSNYLFSMGGTEKVILEQVESLLAKKIDSFFVYPKGEPSQISLRTIKKYGVIVNGYELLELAEDQLESFFAGLQFQEIHIHHLLHWPLNKFVTILERKIAPKKVRIFANVHDFHFDCPNLRRFDKRDGRGPYSEELNLKWQNLYARIWEIANEVAVPSEFMKLQVKPKFQNKIKVVDLGSKPTPLKAKKVLAYLGADAAIKGYDTWIKLSQNALIKRSYDLLQIGGRAKELAGVSCFNYSFHDRKGMVASEMLISHKVDYVLLWSQVPESFSFTMHEAMAANKFIITSQKSGNIAHEISKKPNVGIVLNSEYELFLFLLEQI